VTAVHYRHAYRSDASKDLFAAVGIPLFCHGDEASADADQDLSMTVSHDDPA
jgi:hypothetical protein